AGARAVGEVVAAVPGGESREPSSGIGKQGRSRATARSRLGRGAVAARAIAAATPGPVTAELGRNAAATRRPDSARVRGNAIGLLCGGAARDACAESRTRGHGSATGTAVDAIAGASTDATADGTCSFACDGAPV